MKRLTAIIVFSLISVFSVMSIAEARPHHRHHHKHYRYHRVAPTPVDRNYQQPVSWPGEYVERNTGFNGSFGHASNGRPADCYGIPWCGCWLRHVFGFPAKSGLNLAANWLRFQSTSPENANVVVWPSRHHVGQVLTVQGGRALVRSGNSGRGGVTVRWIPTHGGFAFRRV